SVDFFYDLADHEIAEMSSSGLWNRGEVFAGDRHVATYNWSTTFFNHADWLGTERSRTALSGAVSETCLSLPFGDGQSCSGSETTPNHFTGKERDSEDGLDYFGARYYTSNMGRWLSPDWSAKAEAVPYAKLDNAQTLNLYAYVGDNPLTKADIDGHQEQLEERDPESDARDDAEFYRGMSEAASRLALRNAENAARNAPRLTPEQQAYFDHYSLESGGRWGLN